MRMASAVKAFYVLKRGIAREIAKKIVTDGAKANLSLNR